MLMVTGCATPQVTPSPTSVAVTCPTAPACSTPAAQVPNTEKTWSSILRGASIMTITFDPGDKCSVSTKYSRLTRGLVYYNIVVNDQAHATYAVIFQSLDEGKTLADLQAYSKTATNPPSWSHSFMETYVGPGSNTYYAETFSAGQIYISCFTSQKSGILRILDFGPVEIK